ncbi:MAG: hypothetical protein O2960_13100, partial [Verrucomicrobia bacterium]|nr:hypothetical protein [Verrucomicrobiota bacterium]
MGASIIAHPFKGGITWRKAQVPKGRSIFDTANGQSLHFVRLCNTAQERPKPLPEHRSDEWPPILGAEYTVRIGADVGHWGIQPSLRDLRNRQFEP